MSVAGIELAHFGIATLETNHYTMTAGSTEIKIKMHLTITECQSFCFFFTWPAAGQIVTLNFNMYILIANIIQNNPQPCFRFLDQFLASHTFQNLRFNLRIKINETSSLFSILESFGTVCIYILYVCHKTTHFALNDCYAGVLNCY